MRISLLAATTLVALSLTGAAYAQSSSTNQAATTAANSSQGTLSSTDKSFLQEAADGADYELSLANLAEQKASKQDVKNFAQELVKDHGTLNSSLQEIADKHGMQLTPSLNAVQKAKMAAMRELSGTAFDKAFLAEMTRINREDKSKLHQEVASTKDQSVKQFAEQMQKSDAKHEQMSQKLEG